MPSSLESLYNQLKGTKVAKGSYDEFQNKMADANFRKGLYNALTKRGAKVGANLEEFDNKLGYGYVAPAGVRNAEAEPQRTEPKQPTAPQQAQPVQEQPKKNEPYKPTEADLMSFGSTIGAAEGTAQNATKGIDQIEQNVKQSSPFGDGTAGLVHNQNLRRGKQKFNAGKGQFEDTYLTTDGQEFKDATQADSVQNVIDWNRDRERYKKNMEALGIGDITGEEGKTVDQRINEAKAEIENLDVEIDKASRQGLGIQLSNDPVMGVTALDSKGNQELFNLRAAKRMAERRLTALEAERDDPNFFGGTWDAIKDPTFYDFGLTSLSDNEQMKGIQQKIDAANGGVPNLTNSERLLARNYLMNQEAQVLNNNRSWWYTAGQGFGQTLSFMKDFALTGGGFANVAKAGMRMGTKAGLNYAASDMAKYLTKNLGVGGKALNKTIQYGAKFGGLAAGAEVGGALQSNTIGLAGTIADISDRRLGTMAVDKEGKLTFKDSESLGKAILNGELSMMGENGSELVGPAFDLMPGLLGRVIRNKATGKVMDKLRKLTSNKVWRKGEKTLDYLGVQGVFGEGMEEEYNALRTDILNRLSDNQFAPDAPEFADGEERLNRWATTGLVSVALRAPQMIASGYGKAKYYGYKYNLNHSDENMRQTFLDYERYKTIKGMIDGADNTTIGYQVNRILNNAQLTKPEKEAVVFYAQDLVNLRGYNIGNIAAASLDAQPPQRVSSYNVRGNTIEEVDQNGNIMATHEYENRDEMKSALYSMQMERFNNDMHADIQTMMTRPNDQYGELEVAFCVENEILISELEAIINKDPLARTDQEQAIVTSFADKLHNTVYDNTMLHEEQSAQDGENIADSDSVDMNSDNEGGAAIKQSWDAAQQARADLFAQNETLAQEVLSRENEEVPHQDIISALTTFSDQEVQVVIDYYNQKAKYEGYINRENDKIDEEAANDRQRNTFTGTINGNPDNTNVVTIADAEGTRYNLVSGNVTTDADGRIIDSESGLIIAVDANGDFVNLGQKDYGQFQVLPTEMTLDQYEEGQRVKLQEQVSANVDQAAAQAAEQEAIAQEQAIQARVELKEDEETTEQGPYGTIHRRPIVVDGKHQVEQVDEPDEKGNYTGSYFVYDGQRYAGMPEVIQAIDSAQPIQPTTEQAEAKAGATTGTGANNVAATPLNESTPQTPPPAPAAPAVTIESVTDEEGMKSYENGVDVDTAITDMIADGYDVNEMADAHIAEAQEQIDKINAQPVKKPKDLQKRKQLQATIDYYNNVKERWTQRQEEEAAAQQPEQPAKKAVSVVDYLAENGVIPIYPRGEQTNVINGNPLEGKRIAKTMVGLFKTASNWQELYDRIAAKGWGSTVNYLTSIKDFFEAFKRGEITEQEVESLFVPANETEPVANEPANEPQPTQSESVDERAQREKEREERRKAEEITDKDIELVNQHKHTEEGRAYLLDRKREPNAEKRRKLAELIYGPLFDGDFSAIRDLAELISSWLGKGRHLDPDSFGSWLGWDMSVGKDAAKVSTMFTKKRENGGDGMMFTDFVHMIWESNENTVNDEKRFTTEEISNHLIDMFNHAQDKWELTEYQLLSRVAEAEEKLIAEEERERDLAESQPEAIGGEIDETQMPFPGPTDEDPFAPKEDKKKKPKGDALSVLGETNAVKALFDAFKKGYNGNQEALAASMALFDGIRKQLDTEADNPKQAAENIEKILEYRKQLKELKGQLHNLVDKEDRKAAEKVIDDIIDSLENVLERLSNIIDFAEEQKTDNPMEAIAQAAQQFKEEKKESKPKSNNKIFTDDAHAEVLRKLKAKFNNLNAGFDPEIALLMLQDAGYHIEKGARKIADCARAMIEELGDFVRPYIKSAYNAVRDYPGMEEIAKDMSSFEEVQQFDPDNFDKTEALKNDKGADTTRKQPRPDGLDRDPRLESANNLAIGKVKDHKGLTYTGSVTTDNATVNTGGKIENVGPAVEFHFKNDSTGIESTYVIYGDIDKIKAWANGYLSTETQNNINSEDNTVNVNKTENNEAEKDVNLQQKPASELEGDSAECQKRQGKIEELRNAINEALFNSANKDDIKLKTMQSVKALAKEYGLEDISDTDLQEIVEAEIVSVARDIASTGALNEWQKYQMIKRLYEKQPSLNARDNDRMDLQQFSTSAPLAYMMDLFLTKGKKVESGLEPSAGNGMLTIGLPKEKMHVNDIDEMRISNLQRQGFGKVTSQDGLQPFGEKQYDVVVTNPPFGNVTPKEYDGGYSISGLEQQMAINALDSMKDDGRAAIIIGNNTEYNANGSIKGKDRAFLNYLYAHYNVVDVININGKTMYARQGTGFPVRMILINGRKPQPEYNKFAPVQSKARAERVNTFDELYKRVNDDILSDSNKPASVHDTESGESNEANASRNDTKATQAGVRNIQSGGSGQQSIVPNGGLGFPVSDSSSQTEQRADGKGNGVVRGGTSRDNSGQQVASTSGTASTQGGGQGVGSTSRRGSSEQLSGTTDNTLGAGQRRPDSSQQRNGAQRGLGVEKVPYAPQSINPFTLQSLMPAEQAEVVKNVLKDIGDVDGFLVKELGYSSVEELHKALAAEQVDSVAMAIHQMNQGNAFIIGDQTGIGKGRQGAALIRYGVLKGGNPVYITKTKELFSDMYRDLVDIGSPDLKPFILSSEDNAADITDKEGKVVYKHQPKKEQERVLDYIVKNGKLPKEYDYIITSYSMFSAGLMDYENGQVRAHSFGGKRPKPLHVNGQKKRDALEKLASNSYVLMDESHNAGGKGSNIGGFLQYITTKAKGVTFLSATFAKRPENMPIYSLKTAISKAGVELFELIDAVKRGGATFQEIMSKALTEAGQMIRRERDMTGVTIDWKGIEDEAVVEKQRKQYDQVISLFNEIIDFQRAYIDPIINGLNDEAAEMQGEVDHTPGTRDMGINNTPFASRTYNMVQQVLLSLKAKETARRAIEHLKEGRKPVIAVANTNERSSEEAAAGNEEDMVMPDLSINLLKGLEGTLRIQRTNAGGDKIQDTIPFDTLPTEAQERYHQIEKDIENASTGLSLSPIDVIKNELKKAGYKVGELTGRKAEFVYNDDGTVKRVARTDRNKKRVAAAFNDGDIDVLVLNRSAGTGISLHASSKFKDQRQRVMIVAQAQPDVNDEVQMRGRIDRTGQVLRGMYEYVVSQIPSEQRLLMMLKAKLRSLDANTTSSQKSKFNEMQVQDVMNKYGDQVLVQYLAEHPDTYAKMADPLKWGETVFSTPAEALIASAPKADEDGAIASKILGRMALLSVREQEQMLDDIGQLYQAEIDRLNEMGENDLEITEMPLKAKTIKKDVWETGTEPGGNNPFADNSYVEKVTMDVLRKPMKADEVKKAQTRLLGGKTWDEYKKGIIEGAEKWAEDKKKETTETITERAKKKANAEKEKYAKGAKKAQEKNQMTDEEIERNSQMQYDTFYNQEMEKLQPALEGIDKQKQVFIDAVETFSTDGVYAIPTNIYDISQLNFEPSFGKLIDIKISDNYSTAASTISLATLDGRRKITIPISGMVKQTNGEKRNIFPTIVSQTAQTRNGMFGSNTANTLRVLEQNLDNWDKLTSTATRKEGYIITGNLLKALVSTREQGVGGKLISYTTDTGDVRQGILMSDSFEPGRLTSQAPISSKKGELNTIRDEVKSANGDVTVRVVSWKNGGFNALELVVPKSKKKGGKFFNDETLRSLMDDQFSGSSNMSAEFDRSNLDAVLKRLDELGVTVTEEHKEGDNADPMRAIRMASDNWREDRAKAEEINQFIKDLAANEEAKSAVTTYAIGSRADLEALRGQVSDGLFREIRKLYNEEDAGAAFLPGYDVVVVFSEKLEDVKDAESVWWHEQAHSMWVRLPREVRQRYGAACWDYLRKRRPDIFTHIKREYKMGDWYNEACSYFIGEMAKQYGTQRLLNGNFEGISEICNFANELKNYIKNGKERRNQLRRSASGENENQVDGGSETRQEREGDSLRDEAQEEVTNNPLDAIESTAKRWKKQRKDIVDSVDEVQDLSEREVYNARLDTIAFVTTEAFQDDMASLRIGQDAIAKDQDIPDSQNAYIAETLSHGKNSNQFEAYDSTFRQPLLETIKKVATKMGWMMGDVDRYVYTKSGLERNRQFFVRDWLNTERKRSIKEYSELNEREQEIYTEMANRIETDFDDGLIETEEKKNAKLEQAVQKAHQQYVDEVENDWYKERDRLFDELQSGKITFAQYLEALTGYIQQNMDGQFDPNGSDYSGFTAMFGNEEGEYDEAEIIEELSEQENTIGKELLDTLWSQIAAANTYGLERYREAGMKTDKQIDDVERMFKWYVPMRGFKEARGEDMYQYFTTQGKANSYVGGLLKHAKGRKSEASYPIVTIFTMNYKAIMDCNQNIVKQHFWRLCNAHQDNNLVVLRDAWAEMNEKGEWEAAYPQIPEDATDEEVREAVDAFEAEMRQKMLEGRAKKITNRAKIDYAPADKKKKAEHTIEVMVNGSRKLMTVVSNPRMAQALNGHLHYQHGDGILSKSKYTRWVQDLNTSILKFRQVVSTNYALNFVVRNAKRDWTHFSMLTNAKEGAGYTKAAEKYYFESIRGMRQLFKKYREGALDESKEIERDFKDFMDNGGITGFVQMQRSEDIQKAIEKSIKKINNGNFTLDKSFWEKILDAIEAYNEAIENRARFATYRASRHYANRTKARSAYDAKEITANYNRRGAGKKTAGFKTDNEKVAAAAYLAGRASQLLNTNKMFFNAIVQSLMTILKGVRKKDQTWNAEYINRLLTRYGTPPFLLACMVPFINEALMWALGGDDDDDDPYANLPEWVRRNNVCIYIGNGNFFTFAMGQELSAFYALGDMVMGLTAYPKLRPVDKDMTDEMMGFLSVFSPVDIETKVTKDEKTAPVSEYVARVYSNAAPLIAIGENMAWTGRPIYKEDVYPDDKRIPEYKRVYGGTGKAYTHISEWLNDLTGGDETTRGWAQINPGSMQYLVEQYMGGVGRFFFNTGDALGDMGKMALGEDQDFNIRKVEGLRAFFQQGDDRTQYYRTLAKYRKYKEEADDLEYRIRNYVKDAPKNPESLLKARELSKGYAYSRLMKYKEYEPILKRIRKVENEVESNQDKKTVRSLYNHQVKSLVDQLDSISQKEEGAE